MKFSKEKIEQLKKDYQKLVDKNFDVGIDAITPLMKEMVHEAFGDQDCSTCGYWMNAKEIIKQHSLIDSINLVSGLVNKGKMH